MSRQRALPALLSAVVALGALAAPSAARADDGEDDDVRVERACTRASTVRLRVRERDDDRLRVDLTLRTPRRNAPWLVVVVHERRLVSRTRVRTGRSSGSLSRRYTIEDFPGRDAVTVRALGPGGEVCRASVTVRED
jgi:hypothetical protein